MGLFDIFNGGSARDRFGKRAVKRLIELGWTQTVRFDPASFSLELGPDAGTVALENTFMKWLRLPKRDQEGGLDQALAFIFELGPDPTFEEAAPMLLPIVRSRLRMMALPLHAPTSAEPDGSPMLNIGEHIGVFPALDRPHSLAHVTAAALADWGRSLDEVMTVARENLAKLPSPKFEPFDEGVLVSNFGDYHDASRLLRPELFEELKLKGDPVVVAVSPEALLIAGSQDITGLSNLGLQASAALAEAVRPISWVPIILREGSWATFQSDIIPIRNLHTLQKLHDYGQQRAQLAAGIEIEGRLVEVSEFSLVQDNDNLLLSIVCWDKAGTLLPRADLILLRDEVEGHIVRYWDDVALACGGFLEQLDTITPYDFAGEWPDADATAKIRAAKGPPWLDGKAVSMVGGRLTAFG